MGRTIVTTDEQLLELLPTWRNRPYALDLETSGLDPRKERILGVALTFPLEEYDVESYYIVLEHTIPDENGTIGLKNFVSRDLFVYSIRSLLAQNDVIITCHNTKFEIKFLSMAGLNIEGQLFDTMVASFLLNEKGEHGLKVLSHSVGVHDMKEYREMHTYAEYGRDEILGVPLTNAANYAMMDTEVTWKLYNKFRVSLVDEKVEDAFYNVSMPLVPVLAQMELAGIGLDLEQVNLVKEEYTQILEENQKIVHKIGLQMVIERYGETPLEDIPKYYLRRATDEELASTYEGTDGREYIDVNGVDVPIIRKERKAYLPRVLDFNPGSSNQISELVLDYLGIRTPKGVTLKESPKTHEVSLDKDNLNTLIFYNAENLHPVLPAILEWRKADKFIGTYLNRFITDADASNYNSIYTNFNQTVVETGRLSSSSPNLQNIPSRFEVGVKARKMFIARPGYDLIVSDLGQAELRYLAHISQDQVLMQAFAENRDLHLVTGAGFASVTYEELKERYESGEQWAKDMRMVGKTGNFALTYGMGGIKFQRYLLVNNKFEVTVDQATEWINEYNATYVQATEWKEKVRKFVNRHGYVLTYAKRKRRLPEVWSKDRKTRSYGERAAINCAIQGSIGDIMAEAMPYIQRAITPLGGRILLQVHDELVAEAPENVSQLCSRIIEEYMVGLCNPRLRCPQVAEAHIAKSWGDAKS